MKKFCILFVILFSFISITGEAKKKTKAKFVVTEFKYEDVKRKDAYFEFTVFFINKGKDSISLRRVVSHCDCTKVEYDLSIIPPGKSGSFKIKADFRQYEGNISKLVYVYLSDCDTPVPITIEACVNP